MTVPRTDGSAAKDVAVIGAGVAGLTAAYLLARRNRVTLYEADRRLGGHAHTHDVTDPAGHPLAIDTGFIVHNDRTYPLLRRLFSELGVTARPTEMSMSIRDERTGLEYAGGRGLKGILAQRRRAFDPRFLAILGQVRRFHRRAETHLGRTDDKDLTTYGDFLRREGFTESFIKWYAVPLVACVWSTGTATALEYPARYLFAFLSHHGMLSVTGSPRWHTVVGGSSSYVDAIAARLHDVRMGQPVTTVARHDTGVHVVDAVGNTAHHDRVVVAVHADQALGMLADPTVQEKAVLGAFRYSTNETVLHTDRRLLPRARQARASWNYLIPAVTGGDRLPVVTYWANRLQGLASDQDWFVTLNARDRIAPDAVVAVMHYEHPIYDHESVAAQPRLASLATSTTVYAGAYHGWGFHEDGCRSGVHAAAHFGAPW